MSGNLDRSSRIAPVLEAAQGSEPAVGLCRAIPDVVGVSGASLTVMLGPVPAPLAWSDPVGARLEELQTTLGEGPCVDAHSEGRSVSEPDLATTGVSRWLAFGSGAREAGVAALFSFPVRIGGIRIGAMTLYRAVSGDLTDLEHGDAQAIADVAAIVILALQGEAPPGALAGELEPLAMHHAALHQASGMVSVQLGISLADALLRLRAHAYGAERPLGEVAADVAARRIRFDGVGMSEEQE